MNVAVSLDSTSRDSIQKNNVAILLFPPGRSTGLRWTVRGVSRTRLSPGVESRRSEQTAPFRVFTVAKSETPITTTGDLQVVPRCRFKSVPPVDVLVVPGGYRTRDLLHNQETLDWIRGGRCNRKEGD